MIAAQALIDKFKKALNDRWGYIWGTAGERWTETKQKELELTKDKNREQGRKYGKKWIGHVVADCSGLFSWAFKQLGGQMYHGSNTMYLKWCTDKGELKKGKRTDGKVLKPGTAVFVYNGDNYSHVGLYIGGDTVIEAQNTLNGVVSSKVTANKWSHWGELKGVDYSGKSSDEVPPGSLNLPTLRRGDKGEYVTLAQTSLIQRGYDLGSYGVDGDFGRATEQAVKQFQQDWGLSPDGVIGPATWAVLTTAPAKERKYKVIISGLDFTQAKALVNNYPGSTMQEE